jgi:hypothetical protein
MLRYSTSKLKLVAAVAAHLLLAACNAQPSIQNREIDELGRFEFRHGEPDMAGVVIGAPHGLTEPQTAVLARHISGRTGAGIVLAYGFKSKRISVAQPVARMNPPSAVRAGTEKRHSVFRELKEVLREISDGEVDLYVEIRSRPVSDGIWAIQAASSGFTLEETKEISRLYVAAGERIGKPRSFKTIPLSIDETDRLRTHTWGIRHHGVLMVAEKGLSLSIPEQVLAGEDLSLYGAVLSEWVNDITLLLDKNPRRLPQVEVKLMDFGRFDTIPSRAGPTGIVIGAPHGTYDAFTAEVVAQLAFRSGLAAVIARGFTPTETGDGRRINVNRPTERHVSLTDREFETERARKTYEQYRRSVSSAAGANLELYLEIHQNSGSRIEVAAVGFSKHEARLVKDAYHAARDRALAGRSEIAIIDLAIEPLDEIEVGAWAAKTNGILALAHRSLHFELPANGVMSSARHRHIYTRILEQLIANLPAALQARVN